MDRGREYFEHFLHHFYWYGFGCWIISGVIWGVMVVGQFFLRQAPLMLLGLTTFVAVILINSLTMIIADAVCVSTTSMWFMCSDRAGGALIGGGISLCFLFLTVYFILS